MFYNFVLEKRVEKILRIDKKITQFVERKLCEKKLPENCEKEFLKRIQKKDKKNIFEVSANMCKQKKS